MAESRIPKWVVPQGEKPQLIVNNSMTQNRVPFITKQGNRIGWYACGPTVYDSAHLGHARAYVTFDIIRRILSDFFSFDIFYVMNITDVDDKIIIKARREYLLNEYKKSSTALQSDPAFAKLVADGESAFAVLIQSAEKKIPELTEKVKTAAKRYLSDLEDQLEQAQLKADLAKKEHVAFLAEKDLISTTFATQSPEQQVESLNRLYVAAKPALAVWLDKQKGHEVNDPAIYKQLTEFYETEFLQDLTDLGVRDVDALTRVTEYIPGIIEFVQKIIANGYAYESQGSVYFDTNAFMNATDADGELKNFYAKLKPSAVGNTELAAEGEGSLGSTGDKKSANDFALWKCSKPGEPQWESPWGMGRPGWHIECSAMATDLLGTQFDIHTGGDDLKFPHHDNELAQSEAYSGVYQWVNYFFHAGKLNIAGLKMSKSLKNFRTIRAVLEYATARQIRILFLLQQWDNTINFDDESLKAATSVENTFKNFFQNLTVLQRKYKGNTAHVNQYWSPEDRVLQEQFSSTQDKVYAAMCDNFNTPAVMTLLQELITDVNKYLTKLEQQQVAPKMLLLERIAGAINRYLSVFGVISDNHAHFLDVYSEGNNEASAGSNEATASIIDTFSSFRDRARQAAKTATDVNQLRGSIMSLSDQLRDDELIRVGIKLEDKADGAAVWKLDNAKELIKQREEKIAQAVAKEKAKLEGKVKEAHRILGKYKLAFSTQPLLEKYSSFDATGVPKTTITGEAVAAHVLALVVADKAQNADVYELGVDALFSKYSTFNAEFVPILDQNNEEVSKSKASAEKKAAGVRKKDFEDLSAKATAANKTPLEYIRQLEQDAAEIQAKVDAM